MLLLNNDSMYIHNNSHLQSLSNATRVSRYQNGKMKLYFTEAKLTLTASIYSSISTCLIILLLITLSVRGDIIKH